MAKLAYALVLGTSPERGAGSNPAWGIDRSVAQLVERRSPKPDVEGSSPSRPVGPRGGIGRRADFKCPCPQGRAGSSPAGAIEMEVAMNERQAL